MKARSLVLVLSTSIAAIACGGGAASSDPAKAGDTAAGAGGAAAASGGAAAAGTAGGGATGANPTGTTTTANLGAGGDLQGTKLTSSSTTVLESDAGAKGPDMAPTKGGEPGRRPEDLQTIIGSRRDQARACYDAALKTHPGIEGNLDVKFTIDPKGTVTDVSVDEGKSDIHEPSVGTCIATVLKGIKFAESTKGFETKAHYPFNFHPKPGQTKKP